MEKVAIRMTGPGMGAIGVVRVCGVRAGAVVGEVSGHDVGGMKVGGVKRVKLKEVRGGVVDDVLVVRVAEEVFEIHGHGGVAVMEEVVGMLAAKGVEILYREEAVGVLGGGILEGEVLAAMPRAGTETGLRVLANQMKSEVGLRGWVESWIAFLEMGGSAESLWRFQSAGQWVMERSEVLRRLFEPARVAIVGAPNAGKSTLANALLGRTLSITTDVAGTTRDWVDAEVVLVGNSEFRIQNSGLGVGDCLVNVPVVLVDTAGVRETGDVLEVESIVRTHEQALGADVVVVLLDGSRGILEEERELLKRYPDAVVAVNKGDLPRAWEVGSLSVQGVVEICAAERRGLGELMRAILQTLEVDEVNAGEAMVFTERQRMLVKRASEAGDASEAVKWLRAVMSGESV